MSGGSTRSTAAPVLVTGCSTGLGLETALFLAEKGFKVYASMRDLARADAITNEAARRGVHVELLQLDVTDGASIDAAVKHILVTDGRIFGLVNNAGIGLRGCLEDLTEAEIREGFEANVFGTINVTKRVLPHMRVAREGRIVNVSSVAGRISSFGLSIYCSAKYALEGLSEALYLETEPFGVKTIIIEPGIINTSRWSHNRGNSPNALNPQSPYYRLFRRAEALADHRVEVSKIRPEDVSRTIFHALTAENPRLRYVVGRPAGLAILAKRYLPERVFEKLYFGSILREITKPDDSGATEPGAAISS